MLLTGTYNRERARAYAERWAFSRNPLFQDFTEIGGDCTAFISQCLYAGSCQMNFTPVFGWYYLGLDDRTASFSGVQFFYEFITKNEGVGPFAEERPAEELLIGDVVQIAREEGDFYHTLLVAGRGEDGGILVAAHSNDAYARPLADYEASYFRYLHILGVRYPVFDIGDCYQPLLEGEALVIRGAGEVVVSEDELVK